MEKAVEKVFAHIGLNMVAACVVLVLLVPVLMIEAWVLRDIWLLTVTPALNIPCTLSIPQVIGLILMMGGVRAAFSSSRSSSKEQEEIWISLTRSGGGLLIAWGLAFALNRLAF